MFNNLRGFKPADCSNLFFAKLNSLATSLQLKTLNDFKLPNALRGRFSRILVEDSSTHRLHHSNSDHSPGHGNGRSKTSLLKVDVTLDLISGSCVQNSLHSGTQQGKGIGKNLVDLVQEGDLVLRDMGYFIIAGSGP